MAQDSARSQPQNVKISSTNFDQKVETAVLPPPPSNSPPPPSPLTPSSDVLSPVQSVHSSDMPEKAIGILPQAGSEVEVVEATATTTVSSGSTTSVNDSTCVFASIFASSPASFSNMICAVTGADRNNTKEPMSLSLSSSLYRSTAATPSLFPPSDQTLHRQYVQTKQPALSATALLQKAAQIGATSSNTSFLHVLGLAPPHPSTTDHYQESSIGHWSNFQSKNERNENSGIRDHLLMGPPGPTTLDFLGLGMGGGTGGARF